MTKSPVDVFSVLADARVDQRRVDQRREPPREEVAHLGHGGGVDQAVRGVGIDRLRRGDRRPPSGRARRDRECRRTRPRSRSRPVGDRSPNRSSPAGTPKCRTSWRVGTNASADGHAAAPTAATGRTRTRSGRRRASRRSSGARTASRRTRRAVRRAPADTSRRSLRATATAACTARRARITPPRGFVARRRRDRSRRSAGSGWPRRRLRDVRA